MVLAKTEAGQNAFKQRSAVFTPRQRSAFILFDGKRSLSEVMQAAAAMGVTLDDIQSLMDHGLLAVASGGVSTSPEAIATTVASGVVDLPRTPEPLAPYEDTAKWMAADIAKEISPEAGKKVAAKNSFGAREYAGERSTGISHPDSDRSRPESGAVPSPQDCFQAAYPIALRLATDLGDDGLALYLLIESAVNYDQLMSLAPKILAAVGVEHFEPLEAALHC